jgi:hypothetical protein
MSQISQLDLKVISGTTLTLQLLLHNQSAESLLLHPEIADWTFDREQIISSVSYVEPVCIVLAPGETKSQKMRVEIPSELKPGQILKNWLRFPGIQEAGMLVKIENIESDKDTEAVTELSLKVNLPFPDRNTQLSPILGLMSGSIELSRIPTRWLVAELLVKLCQIGEVYAQTPAGSELLQQLRVTTFFKCGVSAFKGIQVPGWISKSLSSMQSVHQSKEGDGSLLYFWESWLFSLAEVDVEAGKNGIAIKVPDFLAGEFVKDLGNDSARWFGNLILGLAKLSPNIAIDLKNIIAAQKPQTSDSLTERSIQSSYNLTTGLSGFDILPLRWLLLEILLLLERSSREYLATESGAKLLTKLRRTRFFKNGTMAFASAQFPRWLAISQSAANAYYDALGVPNSSRGVVFYWENWLWNLATIDLNSAQIKQAIFSKNISSNLLANEWDNAGNMDAEQWFGSIVLGLVQLSPRIATQIQNIADRAPDCFPPIPQNSVTYPI